VFQAALQMPLSQTFTALPDFRDLTKQTFSTQQNEIFLGATLSLCVFMARYFG
jgi:hypothetical protein